MAIGRAGDVPDPEIPVLSVVDLGIVRDVSPERVTITPTYTGCPATQVIERDIRAALDAAGFRDVAIETTLSPPWTTDWISEEGRAKLHAYGIAPPSRPANARSIARNAARPRPRRSAASARRRARRTGAAASCVEPFDLFKCHCDERQLPHPDGSPRSCAETAEARSIRFDVPEELRETFRFKPGQHLTLKAEIGGEEMRRNYSLCVAPQDGEVMVTVKRIAGGVFSNWANDNLQARRRDRGDGAARQLHLGFRCPAPPIIMSASPAARGSPRSCRC